MSRAVDLAPSASTSYSGEWLFGVIMKIKLKRKHDPGDWSAARYRITLFLPAGLYPRGTFCTPLGIFHADPDIAFTLTFGTPWNSICEDLPYSEVNWLLPEVVRLLGSLIMSERYPEGLRCRFYPKAYSSFVLDEDSLDLERAETAQAVKTALLSTVGNRLWGEHVQRTWKACFADELQLFNPHELCIDRFPTYWREMSTTNHLLMRGLQALIKSDMLGYHDEFQEEGKRPGMSSCPAS